VTPYEELTTTGRLGPAGASLLYRTVRALGIARGFPPPDGHSGWGLDACAEVAHDLLVGPRGVKRVAAMRVSATDDPSLERLLQRVVLNALRDLSRQTDMGALVLRVREVLDASDRFEAADAARTRWRLIGHPSGPNTVPDAVMAAATARETSVTVPRWSSERRRAPLADRETFERLLTRALEAADGAVTAADLARAVAARLDPVRVPLATELDTAEQLVDRAPEAGDIASEVVSRLRAREIFDSLSDRERILAATWDRPVRDLGALVGVRHSQASAIRQRLAEGLREALAGDDDADLVVSSLVVLATGWLMKWTAEAGPTFEGHR